MVIDTIFQPGTVIGTTGMFVVTSYSGGKSIFINESPVNLNFTFGNGQILYVPSYDRRKVEFIGQMNQPNGRVNWTIQSVPLQLTLLANQVVVESYQPGECIVETYPSPLIRQMRANS